MLEDLPDVPPALNLILAELVRHPTIGELRRIVKGMLPDLRDQSRSFILRSTARDSYDRDPLRFDIHLHGARDLLSGRGCSELRCRVNAAERIARSVGLIADRIWLTDHLSEKLADFGRVSNAKLDDVINDVLALSPLLPLITFGVKR